MNKEQTKSDNQSKSTSYVNMPPKPDTIQVLESMFEKYRNKHGKPPEGFTYNVTESAHKWIEIIEKPTYGEAPTTAHVKKGVIWKTPYLDRLKKLLNHFMSLSRDKQLIIVNNSSDTLHWRGENIELFKSLVGKT